MAPVPGNATIVRIADPGSRRRALVAAAILAAGLSLAAVVYVATPELARDPDIDEMFHSRRYERELERIGGKAGLLANDLDQALAGLWEGKARACTLAVGTLLVAGAYLVVTRPRADD